MSKRQPGKRRDGKGDDSPQPNPPPPLPPPSPPPPAPTPLPPWASVLECEFSHCSGRATDNWARLSLAVEAGDGELVSVRLRRGDLAMLVADGLQVLTLLGDAAACAAQRLYVEAVEVRTGPRRTFRPPGAPPQEPDLATLKGHGKGPPMPTPLRRRGTMRRQRRPFGQTIKRFLKVRFSDTPGRRPVRIAILGGFECREKFCDGVIIVCRWRVPVSGGRGRPPWRDFLVFLPGQDERCRTIKCLGTRFRGKPLSYADWQRLSDTRFFESVALGTTLLTRVSFDLNRGNLMPFRIRTAQPTYRVTCPIASWQRMP